MSHEQKTIVFLSMLAIVGIVLSLCFMIYMDFFKKRVEEIIEQPNPPNNPIYLNFNDKKFEVFKPKTPKYDDCEFYKVDEYPGRWRNDFRLIYLCDERGRILRGWWE